MDDQTLELLRTSLGHVLTSGEASSFLSQLDELGWDDVVADDDATAVRTLFEVKGESRSSAPALDVALAARLTSLVGDTSLRTAVLALGPDLLPAELVAADGEQVVDIVTLAPVDDSTRLYAAARAGDELRLTTFATSGLERRPIGGLDPSLGLTRLVGTTTTSSIAVDAALVLEELGALGRRALGAELCGLAEVMLRDAVAYAGDRRQYGRAIGSFQAVQHRLADARAALTGAAVVVAEAFADGSPWTATAAKALAGRGFEEVSRQCQQTYGAIGFTFEHDFHRFLRRGYLLDACLGDWRSLQESIGRELATTRTVPRIGSL